MQEVDAWPGLPVGRGLLWRCPRTRALMLTLAATAATASCVELATLWGWRAPSWVGPALLWVLALGSGVALWHQRHLTARQVVGTLAGTLGALGAWAALVGASAAPWALPAMPLVLTGGGLGGMAFATIAGRAHWLWGAAFGLAQGGLLWLVAPGATSAAPGSTGLAWHLAFGALLGWLNQRLQPSPPGNVKIIFFHDYRSHRPRPSGASSRPVK
ncbi:MAG: hypothetical protein VKQ33_07905 [Candidatus Sericytochromatia bacterium]|nr:hypothetical protein [Candidatus Sericytochromatia bacterium]